MSPQVGQLMIYESRFGRDCDALVRVKSEHPKEFSSGNFYVVENLGENMATFSVEAYELIDPVEYLAKMAVITARWASWKEILEKDQ